MSEQDRAYLRYEGERAAYEKVENLLRERAQELFWQGNIVAASELRELVERVGAMRSYVEQSLATGRTRVLTMEGEQ